MLRLQDYRVSRILPPSTKKSDTRYVAEIMFTTGSLCQGSSTDAPVKLQSPGPDHTSIELRTESVRINSTREGSFPFSGLGRTRKGHVLDRVPYGKPSQGLFRPHDT